MNPKTYRGGRYVLTILALTLTLLSNSVAVAPERSQPRKVALYQTEGVGPMDGIEKSIALFFDNLAKGLRALL